MNTNQTTDAVFKAWSFESEEPYFIVLFALMWIFSIIPSFAGYPFILTADIGLILYLLVDAIVTLFGSPSY